MQAGAGAATHAGRGGGVMMAAWIITHSLGMWCVWTDWMAPSTLCCRLQLAQQHLPCSPAVCTPRSWPSTRRPHFQTPPGPSPHSLQPCKPASKGVRITCRAHRWHQAVRRSAPPPPPAAQRPSLPDAADAPPPEGQRPLHRGLKLCEEEPQPQAARSIPCWLSLPRCSTHPRQ